jgi:NAD(P)-dependent dehydrogenase (short-subunit alcohol dehydrogenase family)
MPGVIVTGGGSGIGLALVSALLRRPANYRIFATGQRALEGTDLAKVLDECTDQDRTRVLYSAGDTGDVDTVQRQYAEATEFFGGDVPKGLFLNAGIGGGRYPLEDFDVDRFDAMLRTNVRGVFLWLRAALPALKGCDEPSQICVTSSVMGSRPVAEAAP